MPWPLRRCDPLEWQLAPDGENMTARGDVHSPRVGGVREAPGSAYLGGILRREPADCRPEITLKHLAAARESAARP